jgi:hypothetical protein
MQSTDESRRRNLEAYRRRRIAEADQRAAAVYDEDAHDEGFRAEAQDAADEARWRLEEARYDSRMNRTTMKR